MGEFKIGTDPDCNGSKTSCFPKVIKRKITPSDLIIHEGYNKKARYKDDIGLIRMDEAVPLEQEDPSSSITPICLPWSEDSFGYLIKEGNKARIAGWGRSRSEITKPSQTLRQAIMPISNDKCKIDAIDEFSQICAGGQIG